jgi:hypothetical protein
MGNSQELTNFDPSKYVDREAAWSAFRRLWLEANPPLDNGYYMCGIGGEWVRAEEASLDHINGRDGALMFDPDNIQPSCGYHNYRKGSRRLNPVVSKETMEFLRFLSNI